MFATTRTLAAALATAAAVTTGGLALTDAPAQAATGTTFCMRWNTGAAYANYPVYLYQVDSTGRAIGGALRSGKTNSSGCGTFYSTPSTVRLRVAAGLAAGGHYYTGWTPLMSLPGSGTVNLGTGVVSMSW